MQTVEKIANILNIYKNIENPKKDLTKQDKCCIIMHSDYRVKIHFFNGGKENG